MNRQKQRGTSSKYKGVYWCKDTSKWRARIGRNNRHLGRFIDQKDAARAYNKAALERFGEFARLNDVSEAVCGGD